MKIFGLKKSCVLFTCLTIGVFIFSLANFAVAAEYCVDTVAELESALDDAEVNGEDDIIKIRQGTYLKRNGFRYISAEANSLTIEGGYNHPQCKKRVSDPVTTIFKHDPGELDWEGRPLTLNSSGVSANFIVTGLTLTGGLFYGPSEPDASGLIIETDGNVDVKNSIIYGNYLGRGGGSVYISAGGIVNIDNNIIDQNGGGLNGSGGPYIYGDEVNVVDNRISRIDAYGPIGSFGGRTVTLINNDISNNAGGISVSGESVNIIKNKVVDNGFSGLTLSGGNLFIDSNVISGNDSVSLGEPGCCAGGIHIHSSQTVTMVNNVIDNNTGISHAGGIWFSGEDDQIFLFNNTIVNNHSNENGGGVSVEFETANSVFNAHSNIILNNSADLLGDDLYIDNNPYGDPVPNGTVNLLNNDLNLTSGFYIEDNNPSYLNLSNNLDNVNPQFGPDGYHLTDSSPLINAGTSQDAPDYDIDGDSRPQDAAYDIGADEFIALDLDIARCTTTKRVSIGGKKDTVEITLAVVNAGTANSGKTCPANVIGMQDSVEVYNETMGVSDQIGKGKTIFQFPDYIPDAVGEIFWTATINDDDPDADVAVASTVVTP